MRRGSAGEFCVCADDPYSPPHPFAVYPPVLSLLWQLLTEKLDIYSMGMIFWAMLGRDTPFERDDTYKDRVVRGERPYVDPSWHRGFVQVSKVFNTLPCSTRGDAHCQGGVGMAARLSAFAAVRDGRTGCLRAPRFAAPVFTPTHDRF